MNIALPVPPALPVTAEIALLTKALADRADRTEHALRLASLLIQRDDFAGAVALLRRPGQPPLTFVGQIMLAAALLARAGPDDTEDAALAADAALMLATTPVESAWAHAERARAELRLGAREAALARLDAALALDPRSILVFKRLAGEWIRRQDWQQVLALTDRLIGDGIVHARILAARTLALAATGEVAAARALSGDGAFWSAAPLPVPPGWPDAAAFNAALAAEIMANPDLRYGRHGTASAASWRVEDLMLGAPPALTALHRAIIDAATRHAASVPLQQLWANARPDRAILQSWCVITGRDGHEQWHMHPDGWLSGGYYVDVPDVVVDGAGEAGCFAFGLPEDEVGSAAATDYGAALLRPVPGLLSVFPSHAYHRTFAHKTDGRRICIAFDICPA